jgi:uncharacterized protein (TIGR00730 family)
VGNPERLAARANAGTVDETPAGDMSHASDFASSSIRWPDQFRGLFERVAAAHGHLVEDALRELQVADVPAKLKPFFDHVGVESVQASFMLVPLIFLAAADASGGVTEAHVEALPILLLGMEAVAINDDAVDRTPTRSGRTSFPMRFGHASATPFTGALLMLMAERSKKCPVAFVDRMVNYHLHLCSMVLWEWQNVYPTPERFQAWLQNRYDETRITVEYTMDSALALNGLPRLPRAAIEPFSRIFQDVDDIVNLVERRDELGENDDLRMGVVTRPLLLTLERVPSLDADVELFWEHYRPLRDASIIDFQERQVEVGDKTQALHHAIRAMLLEIGVPETVRCMLADADRCVLETPEALRPFMRELVLTIMDRLRHCGHAALDRLLDEGSPPEQDVEESGPLPLHSICVYSSSSDVIDPAYREGAVALGAALGRRGMRLVFGGSNTGLMGVVARAVKDHGGEITGVIPEIMRGTPYVYDGANEIVAAKDLRARKAEMEARADAFVVLPGGLGTLDELLEVLAAKQMHFHEKPIVLLNVNGFYEPLANLFEHLFRERFASAEHHRNLYHLADDIEDALSYLDTYAPPPFPARWF